MDKVNIQIPHLLGCNFRQCSIVHCLDHFNDIEGILWCRIGALLQHTFVALTVRGGDMYQSLQIAHFLRQLQHLQGADNIHVNHGPQWLIEAHIGRTVEYNLNTWGECVDVIGAQAKVWFEHIALYDAHLIHNLGICLQEFGENLQWLTVSAAGSFIRHPLPLPPHTTHTHTQHSLCCRSLEIGSATD